MAKHKTAPPAKRRRTPTRKTTATPTLGNAIKALLRERDLRPSTRRAYGIAYEALLAHYGERTPVSALKPPGIKSVMRKRWQDASAATWNLRASALQAFGRYGVRNGWFRSNPAGTLERRRSPRDASRAIAEEELAALWSDPSHPLRDRLLWCCLYATAARAREVLGLNIEQLDLPRKRAWIVGKGAHKEAIVWDAATSRMLRRYIRGRTRGPVFVTERRANVVPADDDLAPDGRARLSYQRAWEIFREASGGRWTLHQIRHSRLTHLAEKGTPAPLLMAKSRHQDLRTLARYVRPGVEAVARLTAEHDPARRRHT